jgi:hypothetical protein
VKRKRRKGGKKGGGGERPGKREKEREMAVEFIFR